MSLNQFIVITKWTCEKCGREAKTMVPLMDGVTRQVGWCSQCGSVWFSVVKSDTSYHASYYDLDHGHWHDGGEFGTLYEAVAAVQKYDHWVVKDDDGKTVSMNK